MLHSSVKNELLQMLMIFVYNVYIMTEFNFCLALNMEGGRKNDQNCDVMYY